MSTHATDGFTFFFVFWGVLLVVFGAIFMSMGISSSTEETQLPHKIHTNEVFVSVLVAGGAYIYYFADQQEYPLVALFSAYLVFATLTGIYRAIHYSFGSRFTA